MRTFPQLADPRVDHCWGGPVDMTLDRMVKAGQRAYYKLKDRVCWARGWVNLLGVIGSS